MRSIGCLFSVILLASFGMGARGATFCVGTTGELVDALTSAASNQMDNTIRVQAGVYLAPSNGFLYLVGPANGSHDLDLEGGWNSGCTTQTPQASLTKLDGQTLSRVLRAQNFPAATGNITIRHFDFYRGAGGDGASAALSADGANADLRVENCRFRLNASTGFGAAINFGTHHGTVHFLNNVVANNTLDQTEIAISIGLTGGDDATGMAYINNNTIADNEGATAGAIYLDPGLRASLANNILWNNGGNGIFDSGNPAVLIDNDIDVLGITPGPGSRGNFSLDPQFIGPNNHRVLPTSPTFNAGDNDPPGGTGSIDLDGNPRIRFGAIDLGAYELQEGPDPIFADGFED